ncbi:unnamed protein product [Prorocentrum cordatum]|uniref:Subtilisin n=1 Tax=Prorocentrum cordatum TaxID=2364126 RepID=A0ABN9RMN3_9DINO|nr:unnamed protein product [Polarella glacialis]
MLITCRQADWSGDGAEGRRLRPRGYTLQLIRKHRADHLSSSGDVDGDGVPDASDADPYDHHCHEKGCAPKTPKAPSAPAHEKMAGVKDSDGDGVPDVEDPAPYDPTCPVVPCPELPCPGDCVEEGDADGDGVADSEDPAPHDHSCHEEGCVGGLDVP